jgi:hypothetical protein
MANWILKASGTVCILLAVAVGSWLDPRTTIGTVPVSLLCIERLWRTEKENNDNA